jgi:choline dehydrogenase
MKANWWNGALEAGFTPAKDVNSGDGIGIAWYTTNVDFNNRTRSDARIVHYDRVSARENYHILAENTVSKVIFEGNKTTGVQFIPSAGGDATEVNASMEVLIAAGGVSTPKILQLSGIGPKSLLNKYGIGVVSDLPGVGANFHDTPHLSIPYHFTNNIVPNTDTLVTNATYATEQRALYESSRQGPYGIIGTLSTTLCMYTLCDATPDCSSIIAKAEAADPATYLPKDSDPTVIAGYTAQRKAILDQLKGNQVPAALVTWGSGNKTTLFMGKPLSRGYVAISSADPLDSPTIDYGSMVDPVDFDVLIATFLRNRDIMHAPSMKVLGVQEASPLADDVVDHDALREAFTKILTPSTGHECCTASMAPLEHGGVVNTDMEVYGVQGLRVIDISTLPMLVATPPAPTIYGIVEKISDTIKKKYCLARSC